MTNQAKTLLQQIRSKNNRGFITHPGCVPVSLGGGAVDEMLQLYIAARETDDNTRLAAEVLKLKVRIREADEKSYKANSELSKLRVELGATKQSLKVATSVVTHQFRKGDVIVTSSYGAKYRRKVKDYDFKTATLTLVNWDKRHKRWQQQEAKMTVEQILSHSHEVIAVERFLDEEKKKKKSKK
jgi:hypothetical protein